MSLAFAACSATAAAACGWPASALIEAAGPWPGVGSGPAGLASQAQDRWRTAARPWLLALLLAAAAWTIAVRLHPALVAAAGCWLAICGVPLAAIDVRVRRLPDGLTGTSLAGVLGLLAFAAFGGARWQYLAVAGAGGLAVGVCFLLLALTRPGSAGLGDAKLSVSTGVLAAWFGWPVLLASVVAAFVLAAGYGLWIIGTRRATLRGTSLPFGPFLLTGCLAAVLLAGGHDPGHYAAALL
jgi:leader peptidase (prepilin peptidase)/N-methyltransferase